jgi:inhibitor of KinA
MKYKLFPLGDNSLTIDFGNEISVESNERVLKLAQIFEINSFEGFIETVPAYSSLTVFYEVLKVRKHFREFQTAFEAVENFTREVLKNSFEFHEIQSRLVEIPVCFEAEFGVDLEFVSSENNLSRDQVIEIFLNKTYRVFMLGFLPGFSYMGEVDERIATPRKLTPRLKVEAGSVGIAGKQTGIYSLESPGGWQIIGQTPIELFTPNAETPTFLQAGDSVKFYAVDKENFVNLLNTKF